jgi:hypothetical protein
MRPLGDGHFPSNYGAMLTLLPMRPQQDVAGKAASVTILRFQQEPTIMIMLKP